MENRSLTIQMKMLKNRWVDKKEKKELKEMWIKTSKRLSRCSNVQWKAFDKKRSNWKMIVLSLQKCGCARGEARCGQKKSVRYWKKIAKPCPKRCKQGWKHGKIKRFLLFPVWPIEKMTKGKWDDDKRPKWWKRQKKKTAKPLHRATRRLAGSERRNGWIVKKKASE